MKNKLEGNHINIFALGGLDENGKNCYVLEFNEQIYVINSGTKIPINSQNGVDTLIPSFKYLEKNKDKIVGVFITDVKNESFSSLPWLLMEVPNLKIYTSKFNKIMIEERLPKYKIEDRSYSIHILDKVTKIGDILVQPIELAGSMPGQIGLDFITPDGDILFMFNFVEGDLGVYGSLNFDKLQEAFVKRNILALVVDAGRSNYEGKAINKINLPESIKDVFLNASQDERIIVGAYDEEMVAIHQLLRLAVLTKRPIITYGKTYGQVFGLIKKAHPDLELPELIDYKLINKTDNAVILVTGTTERLFNRFLRITDNNDVFLKLKKTDNVIMIAPPINGLEKTEALMLDDITRVTPKVAVVSSNEFYRHRPARQDIVELVQKLKPKFVIPVQGLYRYLADAIEYIVEATDMKSKNVLLLQNGRVAHFFNGELASTKGKVKDVKDVIIDGFGVGDISSEVINERETLGRDGVVLVTVQYSPKTKNLVGKMQVNYVGVFDKDQKKEVNDLIKNTIVKIMDENEFEGLKDFQNRARSSIRKKLYKNYEKEPMVIVSLVQTQA